MSDLEKLQALLSASGDAAVILDQEDRPVWWNDRALALVARVGSANCSPRLDDSSEASGPETVAAAGGDMTEGQEARSGPAQDEVVDALIARALIELQTSRVTWRDQDRLWMVVLLRDGRRDDDATRLNECEDRFSAAVEAVQGVVWTNTPDGRMEGDQPGWRKLTGQAESEYRGFGWANAVHPANAAATVQAWLAAVAEKRPFVFEHRIRRYDGVWRDFSVRAIPVLDPNGQVREWVGVHTDITDERMAHIKLTESEARFRAIADAAPSPVWITSAEGDVEFVNTTFAAFAGRERGDLLGNIWLDLLHPEDVALVLARRAQARSGSVPASYSFEARFRTSAGDYRWMLANARPRFDEAGFFRGYVGMAMDLTDIKEAQSHQRLLINELNHRVKNTLATIQSIVRQTLNRAAYAEVRGRLTERLMAMSSAHDVLTRKSWSGAGVKEVIDQALKPFVDDHSASRVSATGAAASVTPPVALALALAIHELATNAVKYGALSPAGGTVRVRWEHCAPDRIRLTWTEADGPKVEPPDQKGFGLRLIERGLAHDLGGKTQLDFFPDGLQARFDICIAPEEPGDRP